jgi:hypothetical protein
MFRDTEMWSPESKQPKIQSFFGGGPGAQSPTPTTHWNHLGNIARNRGSYPTIRTDWGARKLKRKKKGNPSRALKPEPRAPSNPQARTHLNHRRDPAPSAPSLPGPELGGEKAPAADGVTPADLAAFDPRRRRRWRREARGGRVEKDGGVLAGSNSLGAPLSNLIPPLYRPKAMGAEEDDEGEASLGERKGARREREGGAMPWWLWLEKTDEWGERGRGGRKRRGGCVGPTWCGQIGPFFLFLLDLHLLDVRTKRWSLVFVNILRR